MNNEENNAKDRQEMILQTLRQVKKLLLAVQSELATETIIHEEWSIELSRSKAARIPQTLQIPIIESDHHSQLIYDHRTWSFEDSITRSKNVVGGMWRDVTKAEGLICGLEKDLSVGLITKVDQVSRIVQTEPTVAEPQQQTPDFPLRFEEQFLDSQPSMFSQMQLDCPQPPPAEPSQAFSLFSQARATPEKISQMWRSIDEMDQLKPPTWWL